MMKSLVWCLGMFVLHGLGQAQSELCSGVWAGHMTYGNGQVEEMVLHIYAEPVAGYHGFWVLKDHAYQIAAIDDMKCRSGRLNLYSSWSNTGMVFKYSEAGIAIGSGRAYLGKTESESTWSVDLEKINELPQWASKIRHNIYKDGVYKAVMAPTYYGHQPMCEVTVKAGRIVDVAYCEKHLESGEIKDEQYGKEYEASLGALSYAGGQLSVQGAKVYKWRLLLGQDVSNIDCVTGATATFHRFKTVIGWALKEAVVYPSPPLHQ